MSLHILLQTDQQRAVEMTNSLPIVSEILVNHYLNICIPCKIYSSQKPTMHV